MIGLDTNVVVRYLTLDHPAQARAAVKLVESLSVEQPGFISLVVAAELVWVLEASYNLDKARIIRVFEGLLQSKELLFEKAEVVAQALGCFRKGSAGLADYLIERSCYSAGCTQTVTFDQRAAASAGMHLLK